MFNTKEDGNDLDLIDRIISLLKKSEQVKSIFNFPKGDYNSPTFINYINHLDYAKMHVLESIKEIIYDYNEFFNLIVKNDNDYNELVHLLDKLLICINNDYVNRDRHVLIYLKILLLVFFCSGRYQGVYNDGDDGQGKLGKSVLFRGQSDFAYELLPSIYRGLNKDKVIDFNELKDLYKQAGFLSKYNTVFGQNNLDYGFVSFIQHSAAYSPLLDFTTNKNVALSFATNPKNKNFNYYYKKDAALYSVELLSESNNHMCKDLDFQHHMVQFIENKLKFDTCIFGKPLINCTVNDFRVEYELCLEMTNDRMKYQKGAFLYFKRCVIVNGQILLPFKFGFYKKYKILSEAHSQKYGVLNKHKIYENIKTNIPYYDIDHLMDPYQYFTEY